SQGRQSGLHCFGISWPWCALSSLRRKRGHGRAQAIALSGHCDSGEVDQVILQKTRFGMVRLVAGMVFFALVGAGLETAVGRGVEPGLSDAVNWQWRVAPSVPDRRIIPEPVLT